MKARVKCIAVLSFACHPFAVITAKIKDRTLVYLDYDLRLDMSRELKAEAYSSELIRGHQIDADTGFFEPREATASAFSPSRWGNAEGMWIDVSFAPRALAALTAWRESNPPREGAIRAPNWRVLTCVRALALAAGLPDPMDPADKRSA